MKEKFVTGWKFLKTDFGTELENVRDRLSEFKEVEIPHDFLIDDARNFYTDATGWYYKGFVTTLKPRHFLVFDGIYMDSTVYINGQKAGEWKYGYSQFILDITDYCKVGSNDVLVRVNYQNPNSRWYSGAGIYRNVWLCSYEDTYIPENGIYVHTHKGDMGYFLDIDTEIKGEISKNTSVSYRLFDDKKREVSLNATGKSFFARNVKEWSNDEPNLYTLEVTLFDGNKELQREEVTIGFRSISFDPDKGFLLNGKVTKLNGVCIHHDLGALGAAYNNSAMKRRLIQLKGMGVNAIRLTHNMFDPQTIELLDRIGFMAISEGFDMWERSKTEFDYARFFPEWHERDVESWVKRDRNHPSVIMWSIGNEIYDTHADERGAQVTRMLKELVEKFDYMGNAHPTFGSNYMPWENAQKCADILKVVGYNYAEKFYEKHHREHPDWVIYGSETYSIVQSRGIYHFPLSEGILADDDLQCSSLGNSQTSWGAESIESCICMDRDMPFSMGQFIWTGYDYIGEPTPYHTKNSYFGLIDTAGFYKDAYYAWKSAWVSAKKDPFVHVFPYWDFNEGEEVDVRVVSNAPFVELFVNGKSLGKQELTHERGSGDHIFADYKCIYEKGEIKAIAYDALGKEIAEQVRRSFEDTDSFEVIYENVDNLVFAKISALDKKGNPVENACDRVKVTVTGGRLIGLDNGDSTDYDSYKADERALFSGKLLAIVEKDGSAGDTVVDVLKVSDIVPVRKVELVTDSETKLSMQNSRAKVTAKVLPENATNKEVFYRILDNKGNESNIAKLLVKGNEAEVEALFDGEFILRCETKDKDGVVKTISTRKFTVSGMGRSFLDPFNLIPGNVFSYSKGRTAAGNEHGVATDRGNETLIAYDGIDFGIEGSDTITIPIFALSGDAYKIQIWDGIAGDEGALLLDEVIYQKKSIWNTYQEETWKLSKRLCGVHTISFVTYDKMHIKGFYFERQLRALCENSALDADSIYGDSFTRSEGAVEGIGNNVTLGFNNMNFGDEGVKEIIITGRAMAASNTIHLRMKNESGETKEILEFPKSSEYTKVCFPIEHKKGRYDISFVFLPGSNFDFKSFRFSEKN
ncbi:glycoside hydrolase family 2 TIM barrel-domain containing protein [Butyrivibrio sp.]|uniref:glycoside hydrolase family 2 TIM barrel-domain containing protein n=1 Tax=Butyrivibrio sp. TaxID=28121 RepID=UPI0025BC28B1|nr:glycoside hydrolase family 2 TIM barrel-domain containing protein [Butyrivibrio sp.]MBE5836894.1 DUF4982 domain-containing protein [Butyrivibrio sp.]